MAGVRISLPRFVVVARISRLKALAQKFYVQVPDWCYENRDWLIMTIGAIVAVLATGILTARYLS